MSLRASIDIGSNSVLLLIAKIEAGKIIETLDSQAAVTSLGKNVKKTKIFDEQSKSDTYSTLIKYCESLDKHGIKREDCLVTATEASRVAKDSKEFFKRVKEELSLNVKIISSNAEAYYTALGVVRGSERNDKNIVIMDIGGASTELIKVKSDPFEFGPSISLPVGSVVCSEWLNDKNYEQKMPETLGSFKFDDYQTDHLVCVAGSMTSIGGMLKGLTTYKDSEVNGYVFDIEDFSKLFDSVKKLKADVLLSKFPFLGKRAKTIVAGARLGIDVGKTVSAKTFSISTLGLRYGVLIAGEIDERL